MCVWMMGALTATVTDLEADPRENEETQEKRKTKRFCESKTTGSAESSMYGFSNRRCAKSGFYGPWVVP